MLMEHATRSLNLRAPQGDGETVIDPPINSLPGVLATNRERLARVDYDVQGRSLADISASARRSLVHKAIEYTGQYRDIPARVADLAAHDATLAKAPFVLSGHQPQLYHPGVWYKNFVLGSLAESVQAMPIHLLIDSDLCRGASIRVPTGTAANPRVEVVAYDEPAMELPYEERSIRDLDTFRGFAKHATATIRSLVPDPLLSKLWPLTLDRNPRETNLGLRIAQGRHAMEEAWGNDTLELPQSAVCQLPEFAWFLSHILAHLPCFWSVYNDALAVYRVKNHLRNRAHPVPDLAENDGWLEAPFWIWTVDDPQRRPLFAKQIGDELAITDRGNCTYRLPLTAERNAAAATEALMVLASRGIKIRTRALTTTLFARLVLSDLFLHGIGGAKYDQVADHITKTFFGFDPPEFAAVSATLRLPIVGANVEIAQGPSCAEQLRQLRYHPERFIESERPSTENERTIQEIVASKRQWINTSKTPENAHERHVAIEGANESLQRYLADCRQAIRNRCEQIQQSRRAAAVLRSREYAFCLFPKHHFELLLK